jgi:hypothetical protein
MTTPLTFECKVHFHRRGRGSRKELRPGEEPLPAVEPGRVPRIAPASTEAMSTCCVLPSTPRQQVRRR